MSGQNRPSSKKIGQLTGSIHELAERVGMRFVPDKQKSKSFESATRVISIKLGRGSDIGRVVIKGTSSTSAKKK